MHARVRDFLDAKRSPSGPAQPSSRAGPHRRTRLSLPPHPRRGDDGCGGAPDDLVMASSPPQPFNQERPGRASASAPRVSSACSSASGWATSMTYAKRGRLCRTVPVTGRGTTLFSAAPCSLGLQGQSSSNRAKKGGRRMTTSGRDIRRSAEAMAPAGSSGPARRPRTSSPDNKRALRLVGLGVVIHMLRSRRFYERVAVGAIVLAAVRNMGQEQRASTFERLSAWNKRQIEILERKAEQQALRLERQAKREARRLERKAKRQARRLTGRTKRGSADRELAKTDGQARR